MPPIDKAVYLEFLNRLLFGRNKKMVMFEPIPPSVGMLKFTITRNKTAVNTLTPSFYLNLEKMDNTQMPVLYAKKMPFKKQSYYLISLKKNKQRSGGDDNKDLCLGKLRCHDLEKTKYMLYDSGENYEKKGVRFENIRREHGAFYF